MAVTIFFIRVESKILRWTHMLGRIHGQKVKKTTSSKIGWINRKTENANVGKPLFLLIGNISTTLKVMKH